MATYIVSGLVDEEWGGDAAFNGNYVESGTYGGKPSYVSAGGKYIFYNNAGNWIMEGVRWESDPGEYATFYVISSADTPPTVGWLVGMNSMGGVVPTITLQPEAPSLTISNIAYILSTTSLQFGGALTSDGASATSITVYWGATDEGEVAGSWANTSAPTSPAQPQAVGVFSKTITGLTTGALCYFKAKATNTTGTTWTATVSATPLEVAAGGRVSIVAGKEIHEFLASDTFVLASGVTAEVLIVAGGGGGGYGRGGGGGAGGLIYSTSMELTAGVYNIIVGTGGISDSPGGDSSFNALTAIGGGAGGGEPGYAPHGKGDDGGSGGGAIEGYAPGIGTDGQGYGGGNGVAGGTYCAGGGGGAGGVGDDGTGSISLGNGGIGLAIDITGDSLFYAGGGGAGSNNTGHGKGGSGIGGEGSHAGGDTSTSGKVNTGSGGGGGSGTVSRGHGGAGADGIIILSYDYSAPEPPVPSSQAAFLLFFT